MHLPTKLMFSKESLENLRRKIDLVEVLSPHVELKRSGTSYKGLCPFHDEKTPSFMIQKGDTHYHCFGCGAHGDAIQFLMSHMRMTFNDAVGHLAEKFHIHLDRIDSGEPKGPSKTLMKQALDAACRFYHFYLLHTPEGHEAIEYLYQRHIDPDFIRHFHIGLAPKSPGVFRKIMEEHSFSEEILSAAGLLAFSNSGGYREFFNDRITFPIHHASGSVIGFSARKYKEETFGGKYINTSETPLFKKSRVLFGINHSRRRIAKERKVIIVEGQIDALRMIQQGFDFTVAGQGTAFGLDHVHELKQLGINKAFLALDSDNAGREAACKIGDFFQHEGIEVKVVVLPPGDDPDSFLRAKGPQAFLTLLETGSDYLEFLVGQLGKKINLQNPAGKNELVQIVAKQIRAWNSPLMVHESLRKLAQLVQVPEQIIGVGQEFVPNLHIRKSASVGLQTVDPDKILEGDFLLWLLLMGGKESGYIELAIGNIKPEQLHIPVCRRIYQTYISLYQKNQPRDLLALIEEPEDQQLLSELMQKKIPLNKAEELFAVTIKKILDRNWMEEREAIRCKIQSGTCSDEEAIQLMKQFDELKKSPPKIKGSIIKEECNQI